MEVMLSRAVAAAGLGVHASTSNAATISRDTTTHWWIPRKNRGYCSRQPIRTDHG